MSAREVGQVDFLRAKKPAFSPEINRLWRHKTRTPPTLHFHRLNEKSNQKRGITARPTEPRTLIVCLRHSSSLVYE